MGTGAGKRQGRVEGGGEGGAIETDTSAGKVGGGGGFGSGGGWEGVKVGWGPEAEPSSDPWMCC